MNKAMAPSRPLIFSEIKMKNEQRALCENSMTIFPIYHPNQLCLGEELSHTSCEHPVQPSTQSTNTFSAAFTRCELQKQSFWS